MPKLDLPKHLRERKHDDWIWPLSLISRGFNAFGPRCSNWRKVPVLLIGYNTTRWMTPTDKDVINVQWKKGLSFGGINMKNYGPSPLQKFSKGGFSWVWPFHFEVHFQFLWKGKKKVFLYRSPGARWDSLDNYYNVWFGYVGFHWN